MENNVLNKVGEAITEALEIDRKDISIDSQVSDFSNWDSLGWIKVIMSLQGKIGAEIDVVKLIACTSIREICECLEMVSGRN